MAQSCHDSAAEGALNNTNVWSHGSGWWGFEVRMLAGWFADDHLLPVPLHSIFSLCVQLSLFYETALVGQAVSPKIVC